MAQKQMNVETLKYKDVRGKELLYLRIKTQVEKIDEKTKEKKQVEEEVLINVGEKTYNSVEELITGTKAVQLEIDTKVTKIEGIGGKEDKK